MTSTEKTGALAHRYVVRGRVQGVGFRWFVERETKDSSDETRLSLIPLVDVKDEDGKSTKYTIVGSAEADNGATERNVDSNASG